MKPHTFTRAAIDSETTVTAHSFQSGASRVELRDIQLFVSGVRVNPVPEGMTGLCEQALAWQWLADEPNRGVGGAVMARILSAQTNQTIEA